jgi:hypothetical protein
MSADSIGTTYFERAFATEKNGAYSKLPRRETKEDFFLPEGETLPCLLPCQRCPKIAHQMILSQNLEPMLSTSLG